MDLDTAIHELLETHTRPDDLAGFVVNVGAVPSGWRTANYVMAWQALWEHRNKLRRLAEQAHEDR